jgi:hypothetical protein
LVSLRGQFAVGDLLMSERSTRDRGEHPNEPEIIPPDRPNRPSARGKARIWVSVGGRAGRRFYVAKPGPFAFLLALLLLGIVFAVSIAVAVGIFLIWIPLVVLIVAALLLSALLRGPRHGPD